MKVFPVGTAARGSGGDFLQAKDVRESVSAGAIQIRGARQNNLAGIDLTIPRNRLVAITGVSGSGKSSLAFDTLFREGQRRFLETLSAYARQFLGRMEKPDVDHVEGLSPAIAVDQGSVQRGPRSTVGTVTEIVDYLRVLYARAGTAHCPEHGRALSSQTPEAVVQQILALFSGRNVHVLAPVVRGRKGHHRSVFADLARKGFVRARVDGEVKRIEELIGREPLQETGELARYKRHTVEVVVDRLKVQQDAVGRLREAIDTALALGKGDLIVVGPGGTDPEEQGFSTSRSCPECGLEAPPLEPRLFSFNSQHGACPECDGLGLEQRPSERLVVGDPTLSIREGALAVTRSSGGALLFPRVDFAFLEQVARVHGFDLDTPWKALPARAKRVVLHGSGEQRFRDSASWKGARSRGTVAFERRYRGVLPALERALELGGQRRFAERFLETSRCQACSGTRLNSFANAVRVGGVALGEILDLPIGELGARLGSLAVSARERAIAEGPLREIARRAAFLVDVGLDYLTLNRSTETLSGGEAQRIRLAAQLGSGLQGVLYVLDEPSIGLHQRDHARLLSALEMLRDAGNSVIVVEHDEATLRASDWLIDIGPGAGRHGGRVVAAGTPSDVARADSPTGRLLRGEIALPTPASRRKGSGHQLVLCGARGFNLKAIDVALPLGTFTVVTGVSGSGKSTLVHHTLQRVVARHLGREASPPEPVDRVEGLEHVEDLVFLSSAPIGRTPRSNPATYTGAFTPIRDLFASLPEAKIRGWGKGRFSFNVAGGRCEVCQGAGANLVELQFLAPVTVPCEECGGKRFQHETLEARFRGFSIADVLALPVEEAAALFADLPKVARPLRALCDVGLGYLTLGQPSTTLSGGEAQRVKLAKHLQRRSARHTLYLLDEPTTGLHQEDVQRLVGALQRLVDQGHTVVVIEHMLELVRTADHVIDLGPEGGDQGGRVVAVGTPEEIERTSGSHTGRALRAARERASDVFERSREVAARLEVEPESEIVIEGARTHNLKNVSVAIPREKLVVVTGPSGSGKSSLALDTIHAMAHARFVESLSTYARQFLAANDRPPVDRIAGLAPSVAVEARTAGGSHPRSTVATTTEIHDHLRVLFARAGVRRCPIHGEKLERTDAGGVARRILAELEGAKGWIVAPIFGPGAEEPEDLPGAFAEARDAWRAAGFVRVLLDGEEVRLDQTAELPADARRVDLVIDRMTFRREDRARIAEAVQQAEGVSGGRVSVVRRGEAARIEFSTRGACTVCGFRLSEELEPRHFSFNTHVGACPECAGLGELWRCDPAKLVDRPDRPLVARQDEGETAITGKLGRYLTKGKGYYEALLRTVAKGHGIDLERPFRSLSERDRELLLFGKGARKSYTVRIDKEGERFELHESFESGWPGLCGHVNAWHKKSEDPEWSAILQRFMRREACPACQGERLASAPRAVTVGKKRLPEVLRLSVGEMRAWLAELVLSSTARAAVEAVLGELASRLALLEEVGLSYLTLDRPTSTLSGGEARRVRLSASLGSALVGVLYVLDEPTVGLHPQDIDRLTNALCALRDGGNSVIVVEHDESLMRRADHLVDIGPLAGRAGGEILASAPPEVVAAHPSSLTARALRGELTFGHRRTLPRERSSMKLSGARLHNLKGVSLELEMGALTGVCGPSGSGKSTLLLDCLVPALRGEKPDGRWRALEAPRGLPRLVVVDASPIGRTPKSVPATAVGLLEPLRELFARTADARMRGLSPSSFSFNSPAGRCPACEGRGATKVEMQFLADLWLPCEECSGSRYRPEVLEVRYRGKTIADVLAMSVDEAAAFLEHVPNARALLETLRAVGLGYLGLGQSSTTLSVGEAQRVKLAAELVRSDATAPGVIVLDEPTTGLSKSDVLHLVHVLARLAERGDAVAVIEHHLDLLAACDRLVELGPAGGESGGRVIAAGTPEELARDPASVTGPWLARTLSTAGAGADGTRENLEVSKARKNGRRGTKVAS